MKGEGAGRTAQQNVGACTHAYPQIAGRAHILAGERALRDAGGRREHSPSEDAARANANIDADRVDRAVVVLRRRRGQTGG